jgi:hypothetical protein
MIHYNILRNGNSIYILVVINQMELIFKHYVFQTVASLICMAYQQQIWQLLARIVFSFRKIGACFLLIKRMKALKKVYVT